MLYHREFTRESYYQVLIDWYNALIELDKDKMLLEYGYNQFGRRTVGSYLKKIKSELKYFEED